MVESLITLAMGKSHAVCLPADTVSEGMAFVLQQKTAPNPISLYLVTFYNAPENLIAALGNNIGELFIPGPFSVAASILELDNDFI